MGAGRYVEAATYGAGEKVLGVVIRPGKVEVHVVSDYPLPQGVDSLPELAERIRERVVSHARESTPAIIAVLVVVAVVGLVLLVLELKPRRPRRVRLGNGTYLMRGVVEGEVTKAAARTPGVLGSSVKVKVRKPGAKVKLAAKVDRGEGRRSVKFNLQENVCHPLRVQNALL